MTPVKTGVCIAGSGFSGTVRAGTSLSRFGIRPSHKARPPGDGDGGGACCCAGTCIGFCPENGRYNRLTTHTRDPQRSGQVRIQAAATVTRPVQVGDRAMAAAACFDRIPLEPIRSEGSPVATLPDSQP